LLTKNNINFFKHNFPLFTNDLINDSGNDVVNDGSNKRG